MDDTSLDRELGPPLDWSPVRRPARQPLRGRYVTLEPMEPGQHADALFEAAQGEGADPLLWLYMGNGPYRDAAQYREWTITAAESTDPLYYAVVPAGSEPAGQVTFMRIDPANGVIEIGSIWFGPRIQRSPVSTEAIYLLAKHAFDDLGYRRLEWKCNDRNARSRRAAERFGFTYEGTFRNHIVVRDRNRDTAWYSIIAGEWPGIRDAFEAWLSPDNFEATGAQIRSLEEIRRAT